MIPQLVTLKQAKDRLRIVTNDDDDDIDLMISAASEIVMDWIKKDEIPAAWVQDYSPITYAIPFKVMAATLVVLAELNENREAGITVPLSDGVKNLLERLWDPALA